MCETVKLPIMYYSAGTSVHEGYVYLDKPATTEIYVACLRCMHRRPEEMGLCASITIQTNEKRVSNCRLIEELRSNSISQQGISSVTHEWEL